MTYRAFDDDRRAKSTSALLALALHAGFLSVFLYNASKMIAPPGPVGATLTLVAFGKDPAAGKPDARTQKSPASQKEQRARKTKDREADKTTPSDAKQSDLPKIMLAARPIDTPAAASSAKNAQNAIDTQTTQAVPVVTGAGSVALGVKANGTAGAPDKALAEAVSSAIANQMRACWNPPVNSRTIATLNNDRRVIVANFAADGSIKDTPNVFLIHADQKNEVTVPGELEIAAIDALRRCSPITLPKTLYPYWQQVTFEFFPGMEAPHAAS